MVLSSAHPSPLVRDQPCRISYGPTVATEPSCRDRRATLRRMHGFDCRCDACESQAALEPTSSEARRTMIPCTACPPGTGQHALWALPSRDGVRMICIQCGVQADDDIVRGQLHRLRRAKSRLADVESLSGESHAEALELLRAAAVAGSRERVHALQRWVDRCAKERWGHKLLQGLDWLVDDIRWDPSADVDTAPLLGWAAIVAANVCGGAQATERAHEAVPRLRALLGEIHPLTQQILLLLSREET